MNLPEPSQDALRTSAALSDRIRADIEQSGGWIGFDRYMRRVLYEPGLGYYSAGSAKFGPAGDFTTAPELGPWLGRLLAPQVAGWLDRLDRPVLLELGAGTGRLAEQLLQALAGRSMEYLILEVSADLIDRQRRRLARFGDRVRWLDALPAEPVEGVIIANEVADALPVARFIKRAGRTLPLGVSLCPTGAGHFCWAQGAYDQTLDAAVAGIERRIGHTLPDGYRSELCRDLPPWLASVSASLQRGAVLLIDYGMTCAEYYHPQRCEGTLICHYRHRAHDDPFLWPGLQDISAWVDFSACAEAATAAGLELTGFTTQAQFLVQRAAAEPELFVSATPAELAALRTLVLPGEMGERFKLMALTKGIAGVQLSGRDFRPRL